MNNGKHIGSKIKALREFLGLTLEEFAAPLNADPSTISLYENKRSEPKTAFLERLFIVYKINPEKFFDYIYEPEYNDNEKELVT